MSYFVNVINPKGTVAVDDTILVKDFPCGAGSHILDGFVPLFDAEVVTRLQSAGYVLAGKTSVGEFGLDVVGEFAYGGATEKDGKLVGAAAQAVADGEVKQALCVDLNGTPRRAAALSGIAFVKPTYGTVSRYGVIPCACSGEQIGVSAATTCDILPVLTCIAGHDAKDGTSLPEEKYEYANAVSVNGKKVALIEELLNAASEDTKKRIDVAVAMLQANGVIVEKISFPLVTAAQTAWQILMAAETCNNVSRYDGVKFGYRTPNYNNIDELYINTRTEGLNFLTKATVLYGSDVLSKGRYFECYDKALKVRRVIAEEAEKLFAQYAAFLAPCCKETAYESYPIENAFEKVFEESLFTAIPSIIGTPAVVAGGVQFMGKAFDESTLLSLAHILEGGAK